MDYLPLDLLQNVIQHIPERDLPQVRLVCRSFEQAATEYLFRNVTVWSQRQSLERLLRISRCGRINKHVRHLTLSSELLQNQVPDPECYLECLFQQVSFQDDSSFRAAPQRLNFSNIGLLTRRDDWTKEIVTTAYAAYKLRVREQRDMEIFGADILALSVAFSLLNNLRSIVIKSDYHRQATVNFPRNIAVLQEETFLTPLYTRRMRLADAGRLHLRNVIRAASITGVKITTLTILDSENTMTPKILALCAKDLRTAVIAFRHVKRFHFKLPDYITEEDVDLFAVGQLARLIQAMPKLEELTLVSSSYSPNVSWTTICGTGRLMSLRVLDLQCFDFHESEFTEFLIRHKITLRTVNLSCVEMYSGTFTSLLHSMRNDLSLTSLGLSGVLEDTNGNFLDYSHAASKALEQFVTRQTDCFPTSLLP